MNQSETLLTPFWETILDMSPDDMKTQMVMASHFVKINAVFLSKKPAEVYQPSTHTQAVHLTSTTSLDPRCSHLSNLNRTLLTAYSGTLKPRHLRICSCGLSNSTSFRRVQGFLKYACLLRFASLYNARALTQSSHSGFPKRT